MSAAFQNELHVLVVDEDYAVVRNVCGRLLAHGYEVATWRHARGLRETIVRTQPDLVLVDVLMPNFNGVELKTLLAQYPATGTPAIILHSAVPSRALCRMIDVRNALGVIEKTSDDVEFLLAFDTVVDRYLSRRPGASPRPIRAMSGTHRIQDDTEPTLPDNVVLWTGDTRRR
ncbi:MAG TPA: response regulator [Polyangiaceae bacterium]|nr:response regulator [Polyangiaceae bacterium]